MQYHMWSSLVTVELCYLLYLFICLFILSQMFILTVNHFYFCLKILRTGDQNVDCFFS